MGGQGDNQASSRKEVKNPNLHTPVRTVWGNCSNHWVQRKRKVMNAKCTRHELEIMNMPWKGEWGSANGNTNSTLPHAIWKINAFASMAEQGKDHASN